MEPTDISSMHRRSQREAQPWEDNPWGPYTPRGQPSPLEAFVQRAVAAASEKEVSSSGNAFTAAARWEPAVDAAVELSSPGSTTAVEVPWEPAVDAPEEPSSPGSTTAVVAHWEPAVDAAQEPSSPGSTTSVVAHWGPVIPGESQPESSHSNAAGAAHMEPVATALMPSVEARAGVQAEASAAHGSPSSTEAGLTTKAQAGAEQSKAAQVGHGGIRSSQHQSTKYAQRQQRGSTDSGQLAAARQRWQWELEERQAAAPQLEAPALPGKSLETEQELEDAILAVHASQAAGQQEEAAEPAGHVWDCGDASAAQASANWWWHHAEYRPHVQPAAGVDRLVQVPESLLQRYQELEWADWRRRYQQWQQACTLYYEQSASD